MTRERRNEAVSRETLPELGCAEDDIHETIQETGTRCIQHIVETLEYRHRRAHNLNVVPDELWRLLRAKARQLYLGCLRQHIEELEEALVEQEIASRQLEGRRS